MGETRLLKFAPSTNLFCRVLQRRQSDGGIVSVSISGKIGQNHRLAGCRPLVSPACFMAVLLIPNTVFADDPSLGIPAQANIFDFSSILMMVLMLGIIAGLILNIRFRHKAQRELFESRQRMELAFSSGELGTWDWDIPSGKLFFDERWTNMLGYEQNEIEPRFESWKQLIHPEDQAAVLNALDTHLSGEAEGYESEFRMRHKDGHWVWVMTKGRVIQRNDKGAPLRACGLHLDISERKKTEDILQLTQFTIDHIVDDALWVNDEGKIVYANNSSIVNSGYSREELLNMTVFDLDPDFSKSNWEKHKEDLRRLKTMPFISRHRRKDGTIYPVEVRTNYIEYEGKFFAASFNRDITERLRAEKELEESERRYMDVMFSSTDPIQLLDNFTFVDCNEATVRVLKCRSKEEALNLHPSKLSPPVQPDGRDSQEKANEMINKALQTGHNRFEWVHRRIDGECFPVEVTLTPFIYKGKALLYSIWRDIAELKRAEEEQRLSFQRTQAMLQLGQMADASIQEITDFALEKVVELTKSQIGYLAFMNEDETVLTMPSWSKSAMADCQIQDKPIVCPIVDTGLWGEAVRQRKPVITNDYAQPNPVEKGTPEGHVKILRHMNAPIFSGNKIVVVAGVGNKETDYTDNDVHQLTIVMQAMWWLVERMKEAEVREKLRDQLSQAQKMESIGRLAGGLAHDFNNMLGGIMGGAELLKRLVPQTEKTKEYLDIIVKSASRAADLTGKLLSFTRKHASEMTPVDIHRVVNDVILILANTIDRRIEIKSDLAADAFMVLGDTSQIQSAFLNLGINASHAMPTGGTLTYHTRIVDLSPAYCESSTFNLSPGKFIELEVRDTGKGISKENLPHIFEPFFTTKEPGQGTGLGLTVTYGAIKQHKGSISVYSEEGKGTSFRILLPLTEEASETLPPPEVEIHGQGVVLLVDDEEVMRLTGKALLEDYGYTVLLAENGKEAIEVYRQQNGKIDLVILDMIMPIMNGHDCFLELRKQWPDARIILSSGFTKDEDLQDLKEQGLNGYIQKPFQGGEFSRIVSEIIGKGKSPNTPPTA